MFDRLVSLSIPHALTSKANPKKRAAQTSASSSGEEAENLISPVNEGVLVGLVGGGGSSYIERKKKGGGVCDTNNNAKQMLFLVYPHPPPLFVPVPSCFSRVTEWAHRQRSTAAERTIM